MEFISAVVDCGFNFGLVAASAMADMSVHESHDCLDGYWSSELFSPKHWKWDLWEVARGKTKSRMEKYIL